MTESAEENEFKLIISTTVLANTDPSTHWLSILRHNPIVFLSYYSHVLF